MAVRNFNDAEKQKLIQIPIDSTLYLLYTCWITTGETNGSKKL